MAFHAGKAFCALTTAALSSTSVLWGTRVTRLFVAGSKRSIHDVAFELTNWLSRKFWVLPGEDTCSWLVG